MDVRPHICEDCYGEGNYNGLDDCPRCQGTGTYPPLFTLSKEDQERLLLEINEEE